MAGPERREKQLPAGRLVVCHKAVVVPAEHGNFSLKQCRTRFLQGPDRVVETALELPQDRGVAERTEVPDTPTA